MQRQLKWLTSGQVTIMPTVCNSNLKISKQFNLLYKHWKKRSFWDKQNNAMCNSWGESAKEGKKCYPF